MFSTITKQLMVIFLVRTEGVHHERRQDKMGKAFVSISGSVALTEWNVLHIHMLKALMHKMGNERRINVNIECYTGLWTLHCLRFLNLKKPCSMAKNKLSEDNISFIKNKNPEIRYISYLADSTWNIYATDGKVDLYEGFSMTKAKWK